MEKQARGPAAEGVDVCLHNQMERLSGIEPFQAGTARSRLCCSKGVGRRGQARGRDAKAPIAGLHMCVPLTITASTGSRDSAAILGLGHTVRGPRGMYCSIDFRRTRYACSLAYPVAFIGRTAGHGSNTTPEPITRPRQTTDQLPVLPLHPRPNPDLHPGIVANPKCTSPILSLSPAR